MRTCLFCSADMEGKRRNAVYCSRRCKTKASDARRVMDGRARERDRARYSREAEARRRYARAAYAKDPESSKTYSREWRKANPEGRRVQHQRRRSRLLGADVSVVTTRDWRRALARAQGCCTYCGLQAPLVMDHIIPLARGGRHSIGNVTPACVTCNSSKSARLLSEWRLRRQGGGD